MASKLSALQWQVLEAFFSEETRFFLTGGAALAGYHLKHRETRDLDLFTSADALADADRVLEAVAERLGADVERLQSSPRFLRRLVRRAEETVVVDLVHDPACGDSGDRSSFGVVRVDPPGEILANKLCALLSRAELRDLADVLALEREGYAVEEAIPKAMERDRGLTPGQLAWVLSEWKIGEDAPVIGRFSPDELRKYLDQLRDRLARWAFPMGE